MNSILKEFQIGFVVLAVFLTLDLPMITLINKKMYQDQLNLINGSNTVNTSRVIISAAITYLLLALGIYYFGVKQKSFYNAAIFGVIVYGVYNFTNLATISKYGVKESMIDTAWGTILCVLVTFIALEINSRFLSGSSISELSPAPEILTTTDVPSN